MDLLKRVARRHINATVSVRDVAVDHDECPLRSSGMYGGIPSGGGLRRYKEYAVAASRIAQALHCTIGSITRSIGKEWYPKGEMGHIREEIGKIEHDAEEYARPVYVDQLNRNQDSEYVQQLVDDIKDGDYDELKQTALNQLSKLGDDLPEHVYELAASIYRALAAMVDAMKRSLSSKEEFVVEPGDNAFADSKLNKAIDEVLKNADRFMRVEKRLDEQRQE